MALTRLLKACRSRSVAVDTRTWIRLRQLEKQSGPVRTTRGADHDEGKREKHTYDPSVDVVNRRRDGLKMEGRWLEGGGGDGRAGNVVLDFQVGDGRGWRTRRGRAGQQQGNVESDRGSSVDRGRRKDAWPCAGLFTRVWSAAWAPTSEQSERRRAGAKKRQDRRPELGPSRSRSWKIG